MREYRFIYTGDFMGDLEDECNDIKKQIERSLNLSKGSVKITIKEGDPTGTDFDVLFFDWGGATLGNSMMEHFCRGFINEAIERPSKLFVMTSTFTAQYMKDELEQELKSEHAELPNIFLSIDDAMPFIKTYIV